MSLNTGRYCAGDIAKFAKRLFDIANHKPLQQLIPPVPENAAPLLAELYRGDPPDAYTAPVRVQRDGIDRNQAWVAFSGGKDSTAVAIKLKDQGHRVTLFNVVGMNPAYPEELKAAKATAARLGCRLKIMEAAITQAQEYVENPAKNQVILGLMIDAGLKAPAAGTYAMGIMTTEEAADVAFEWGYSDAIEMQRAAKAAYEDMAPGIEVKTELLANERDSYQTIVERDEGLLQTIQSCMTPVRYRRMHHQRNRDRYGASIMENRCGSCYKCAQEILILQGLGALPPHPKLKNHAIDVLVRNATKLIGPHAERMTTGEVVTYFTEGR